MTYHDTIHPYYPNILPYHLLTREGVQVRPWRSFWVVNDLSWYSQFIAKNTKYHNIAAIITNVPLELRTWQPIQWICAWVWANSIAKTVKCVLYEILYHRSLVTNINILIVVDKSGCFSMSIPEIYIPYWIV